MTITAHSMYIFMNLLTLPKIVNLLKRKRFEVSFFKMEGNTEKRDSKFLITLIENEDLGAEKAVHYLNKLVDVYSVCVTKTEC